MQKVISVANMRDSDAYTIANYVESRELMYRAAMGVFLAAEWRGRIGILTGSGNNGGDGYALACILADRGIPCVLLRVSEKFSEDGRYYFDKAVEKGVEQRLYAGEPLDDYDILADCLLGTGFSGTVRGSFRAAIEAANRSGAYTICVDINSGMNGDTGKAELAVKSDLTVTIGYLKSGLFLGDAPRYVGKLITTDIGIRLLREEYFLAAPGEAVFPNTGLSLDSGPVLMRTPGELEGAAKEGETVIDAARAQALAEKKLVRLPGQTPLVTDGYRTYFVQNGAFPLCLPSLGEASGDGEEGRNP